MLRASSAPTRDAKMPAGPPAARAPRPARALSAAPEATHDAVYERLLAAIVSGRYRAGVRLPAERALALELGASRPTLREALRRLAGCGLIETRRGSGIVVRDRRSWSIEVLPAYLRFGTAAHEGDAAPGQVVADLLTLRRALLVEVVRLVAGRIRAGGTASARAAVERAWALRGDRPTFAAADLEVMRAVVEAAGFLPAVWMLNQVAGVYLDVAGSLVGAVTVPASYRATWRALLDALEAGAAAEAVAAMRDYLDEHDRALLVALGISSRAPGGRRRRRASTLGGSEPS